MGLLDAFRQYVSDVAPGGLLNPEWTPGRGRQAKSLLMDFTPVVGGVKGAHEEWRAGNPGWAAVNAAMVPLDVASLGGASLLKGGLLAMARPKYWDALVDVLKSGKAADTVFGKVSPRNEQRVNALREALGQPLIQQGDNWIIPKNVVQKLMDKRITAEGMSPEGLADSLNSAVHSTRNRVFQSREPHIQGLLTPKDDMANIAYVGVSTTTGDPIIKTGFRMEGKRGNKAMGEGESLLAGRSSAIDQPVTGLSTGGAIPEQAGTTGILSAPLDMSSAARMARAEEQGFDTGRVFYHGTAAPQDFQAFSLKKAGGVDEMGRGIYAAPNPEYANAWARGENGRVLPLLVPAERANYDQLRTMMLEPSNLGYVPELDDLVRRIVAREPDWAGNEKLLVDQLRAIRQTHGPAGLAKKAGYPAMESPFSQVPGQVMVFDPANIRSVNAAFDPANVGKAGILGQATPEFLGLLGGGTAAGLLGYGAAQGYGGLPGNR